MSLTIAIVGAGYSGLVLTAHLHHLAESNIHIYLIDAAPKFGLGVTYQSTHLKSYIS